MTYALYGVMGVVLGFILGRVSFEETGLWKCPICKNSTNDKYECPICNKRRYDD